MTVMMKQMSFN